MFSSSKGWTTKKSKIQKSKNIHQLQGQDDEKVKNSKNPIIQNVQNVHITSHVYNKCGARLTDNVSFVMKQNVQQSKSLKSQNVERRRGTTRQVKKIYFFVIIFLNVRAIATM